MFDTIRVLKLHRSYKVHENDEMLFQALMLGA